MNIRFHFPVNRIFQVLVISLMIGALFSGCAGKSNRSYDPYASSEDAPSPNYEERRDDRYFAVERYDEPEEPVVKQDELTEEEISDEKEPIRDYMDFDEADYELGPGDVLEVIYQLTSKRKAEEYRISIQDELEIKFFYTPKYNARPTVRVDGKIRLPLVGDVEVYGKTTSDVEDNLLKKYTEILKDPVIHVSVLKSNWAIEELKRAITTAPRGQSRLEPIRPDGFISLPLIGDILLGGYTVPEASNLILEKYREAGVENIDVTVVLLEVKSPVAYVMGEVMNPGPRTIQEREDVWRTIAESGGFTAEADKKHVVVAKRKDGEDKRYVLNFDQWRTDLDEEENIMIERTDIIYVPKLEDRYVYILGAVKKPGRYPFDEEQKLTASQALALGGRITARANERQVLILRQSPENDPIIIALDMKAVFEPKNYDDPYDHIPRDPILQPGDIVFVPRSNIGNLDRFAQAYFKEGIWTIIPLTVGVNYSIN